MYAIVIILIEKNERNDINMFDALLNEIEKIKNTSYSMRVLADREGYIDKECPDSKCLKKFKVFGEDWSTLSQDAVIHCPFCGFEADFNKWNTTEQIKQAREQAIQKVQYDINKAIEKGAKEADKQLSRKFNRDSFIKMNISYKGKHTFFVDMPAQALDEMQQKIECPFCHFKYEVIGSGFFCPKCGENSAEQTFTNTIDKVKGNIKNLPIIFNSISAINKDEAARTCESLRINSLNDLVVAFQRLCESLYGKIRPTETIKKNLFQRLDDGSQKFKDAINYGYNDLISDIELQQVKTCFQKRHCFTHNDGIVDEDYIKKSGDNSHKLGQHLNVSDLEILNYMEIVNKLGKKLIEKAK